MEDMTMKKLNLIAISVIAAGIAVMNLPVTILLVVSGVTTLFLLEQRRRYLIEVRGRAAERGGRKAA
jgi:hypothetical protein